MNKKQLTILRIFISFIVIVMIIHLLKIEAINHMLQEQIERNEKTQLKIIEQNNRLVQELDDANRELIMLRAIHKEL